MKLATKFVKVVVQDWIHVLFFGASKLYSACMLVVLVVLYSPRIRHYKALVVLEIGENIDKDFFIDEIFTIKLPKAKKGIEIFMYRNEMFILCYLLSVVLFVCCCSCLLLDHEVNGFMLEINDHGRCRTLCNSISLKMLAKHNIFLNSLY